MNTCTYLIMHLAGLPFWYHYVLYIFLSALRMYIGVYKRKEILQTL